MTGTIIQNWWHTKFLHWGYVHQAALMTRIARRVQRSNTKDHKEGEELKKLLGQRVIEKEHAQKEFDKEGKILDEKAKEIFEIARIVRTILQKDMDRFSQLMMGIHDDPNIPNKDGMHKLVIDMEAKVIDEAKSVMQSWGSYSSITITAWKGVDEASEIADLIYQAYDDRKQTRKFKRVMQKEMSALRGGKLKQEEHEKNMKQILEFEQLQLQQLTKILNHCVYLLQRLQKHIDDLHKLLEDYRARENMPSTWEKVFLKKIDQANGDIKKFLDEELREDRVFVGDLEHQQAT